MSSESIELLKVVEAEAIPDMLSNELQRVNLCCKCGALLEFDSALSRIRCSSDKCAEKLLGEATRALRFLGASKEEVEFVEEYLREQVLEDIANGFDCGAHAIVSDYPEIRALVDKYVVDEVRFNELLGVTGIELLRVCSEDLLIGYRAIRELYDSLNAGGVVEVIRRLRLEDNIILANAIYRELLRCENELLEIERMLNVKIESTRLVKIAGEGARADDVVGVATSVDAEIVKGYRQNTLYGELVDAIERRKRNKGMRPMQKL